MFCGICGTENPDTGKFCVHCGEPLDGQPARQEPAGAASKDKPHLWNPNAAANWSLLFTPVFGAWLNKRNWEALGEHGRAKTAAAWLVVALAAAVTVLFLPQNAAAGVGFWLLVIWYFAAGRRQAKYVHKQLGGEYVPKPWGKPIGAAIGGVAAYLVIGAVVLGATGQLPAAGLPECDSSTAHTTLKQAFDESQFARVQKLSAVSVTGMEEVRYDDQAGKRVCEATIKLNNTQSVDVRAELKKRSGGGYLLEFEVQQ